MIRLQAKPYFFFSIILVCTLTCATLLFEDTVLFNWSTIRNEVKTLALPYENDPILLGAGPDGTLDSEEFYRRKRLTELATHEELIQLTNHPISTVKAIAYTSLLSRIKKPQEKKNLILDALKKKTSSVHVVAGCLGYNLSLSEYLIEELLQLAPNAPPLPSSVNLQSGLSDLDKQEILTFYQNQNNIANFLVPHEKK